MVTSLTPEETTFVSELMALSATGIIMKKGVVSVRALSLSGYSGALLALIFNESPDGYIVGLPAQLTNNDNGAVDASFVTATPIVKIQKHSVTIFSLPTQLAFMHYLKALKSKYSALPGYFTEERKMQISLLIEQISATLKATGTPDTPTEPGDPEPIKFENKFPELPPEKRARILKESKPIKNPLLPSDNAYFIDNKNDKYLH